MAFQPRVTYVFGLFVTHVFGLSCYRCTRFGPQEAALRRFLDDGRLPLHNNGSELELRREAIGRKNWLFVGNDDAAAVNTTMVTLIASCQMHDLEPWAYLRDLLCVLPQWPAARVLELAPAYWKKTREDPLAEHLLTNNIFRRVSLGEVRPHDDQQ